LHREGERFDVVCSIACFHQARKDQARGEAAYRKLNHWPCACSSAMRCW